MSAQPTPAEPTSDPSQQAAADAQYYRAILHRLIDQAVELADIVHAQAKTQAQAQPEPVTPAEPQPDITIPFDRITRAIRRTVALARHIAEPVAPAPGADRAQTRVAARSKIIRDVEDAIQRSARGAAADTLNAELVERLDGPDLDADIFNRPVADIVADICRDLGIAAPPGAHPWKRRTPADIRSLNALATSSPDAARPATAALNAVAAQPAPIHRPAVAARPAVVAQPPPPAGDPPRPRQRPGNDPPADLVQAGAMILRYANLNPNT